MELRYELLKKKYEKLYNKILEKNKEILIESFVEYYGEKHRDEIVSRFNEIIFVYFIDWRVFSNTLENVSLDTIKKEFPGFLKDLKKFFQYFEKISGSFEDSFVGSSDKKTLKELSSYSVIRENFKKLFDEGNPSYINLLFKNRLVRLVSIPILVTSEQSIIHEINHALSVSLIAIISNQIEKDLIDKRGLITTDEESNLNELVNERASLEIFEIFKRRGGDLSTIYLNVSTCDYTKNLYLIDEFYNRHLAKLKYHIQKAKNMVFL